MKKRIVTRANEISSMLEIIHNIEQYKENSQNGLVILLNGAWGTGKTTYLNDLKEKIKESKDVELFNDYNAYEYDCYDNAYIPLFASIAEKIKLDNDKIGCIAKSTAIGLSIGLSSVGKAILNKATGIDINGIKDDIKLAVDELDINILEDFENFKNSKIYIKTKMCEVCKDSTQVFIIDELDRCKPNFAMDTLEIVKHFFDVPNCVFIIAVDKLQLEQSARAIYGAIDSEKYFSKLFDYQFNLLPINLYEIIEEATSEQHQFVKRSTDIFNRLNVSLRDSQKIINDILSKSVDWTMDQMMFMLFFFILKYTDLTFYNVIINGEYREYVELIKSRYDSNLNKYKGILKFKISNNLSYGEIIQSLYYMFQKEYGKLSAVVDHTYYNIGDNGTTSIQGSKIAEIVMRYLPTFDVTKSVKENLKGIVG